MRVGRHLRELWRTPVLAAACALVSLLAAVSSVAQISLAPPGLHAREMEMAAASTRVLVDAPSPSVLDLSVSVNDFEGMKNRALLVGNIMAAAPVREYIARRAGIAPEQLQVSSPVTPEWPRPLAINGNPKHTTDIAKSPDEHRVSIRVNPTVPIIDVYAQSPDLASARHLADATVRGMQDYLRDEGAREAVPASSQVRLEQLGRSTGDLLNPNVSYSAALLVFLLTFAATSGLVVLTRRILRGWREQGDADPAGVHPAGASGAAG